jgi:hypothetical protein
VYQTCISTVGKGTSIGIESRSLSWTKVIATTIIGYKNNDSDEEQEQEQIDGDAAAAAAAEQRQRLPKLISLTSTKRKNLHFVYKK